MRVSKVSSVAVTTLAVIAAQNLKDSAIQDSLSESQAPIAQKKKVPDQRLTKQSLKSVKSVSWLETSVVQKFAKQHQASRQTSKPKNVVSRKQGKVAIPNDLPPLPLPIALGLPEQLPMPKPASQAKAVKQTKLDQMIAQLVATGGDRVESPAITTPVVASTPSSLVSTSLTPFNDVQGHVAEPAILTLVQRGVLQGYKDGSFRPDRPITKTQFVALLKRADLSFPVSYKDLQQRYSLPTRADAAIFIDQMLSRSLTKSAIAKNSSEPKVIQLVATQKLNKLGQPAVKPTLLKNQQPENLATNSFSTNHAEGRGTKKADNYRLESGDRLRVDVLNLPEYSGEVTVLITGEVSLPLVGSLYVEGMTLQQASDEILRLYAPLLTRGTITLSLIEPRLTSGAIAKSPKHFDRNAPLLSTVSEVKLASNPGQPTNLKQARGKLLTYRGERRLSRKLLKWLQSDDFQQGLTQHRSDRPTPKVSAAIQHASAEGLPLLFSPSLITIPDGFKGKAVFKESDYYHFDRPLGSKSAIASPNPLD